MSRKISGILSVVMRSQPKGLFCVSLGKTCKLCCANIIESVSHVLFECESIVCRKIFLDKLTAAMPPALLDRFEILSSNEKCLLLLSAFNCKTIVDEWMPLYMETANFVYKMFSERKKIYLEKYDPG